MSEKANEEDIRRVFAASAELLVELQRIGRALNLEGGDAVALLLIAAGRLTGRFGIRNLTPSADAAWDMVIGEQGKVLFKYGFDQERAFES